MIHGCNPPDDIYLVAKPFKKHGVDYVFDHHDICPELYEAKFGKKSGLLYKSQLWLERNTYKHCTFAFVTNESYKKIAIEPKSSLTTSHWRSLAGRWAAAPSVSLPTAADAARQC